MKNTRLLFTLALCAIVSGAYAGGNLIFNHKSGNVTFIKDRQRTPDIQYQHQLRHAATWQNFMQAHGTWYVQFNEENALPHRAFGKPIPTTGGSFEARAMNFINSELSDYNIPATSLRLRTINENSKHVNAIFLQEYQGLEVLWSRMYVKMTHTGEVILFGADVYDDIDMSIVPAFGAGSAIASASANLPDPVVSTNMQTSLAILPIPGNKEMDYRLVYQIQVKTKDEFGIPGDYRCYVDANSGELLYRQNMVAHFGDDCDHACDHGEEDHEEPMLPALTITLEGTVVPNPQVTGSVQALQYAKVTIGGTTYYTDASGMLSTSDNAPIAATLELTGLYCDLLVGATGSNQSSFTYTINSANETISWDGNALDSEISAYHGVNEIHDHMKAWTPAAFTAMDNPLTTRVERTDGDCNAFYDGSSINFYAATPGGQGPPSCPATAYFNDVVYHEYGHGINYDLYNYYGGFFGNGALGEAYADVWAFSLTNNAILGDGFQGPGTDVRRYDINPKIYPQDLVGEVHADGEIIAGAWWDLAQEIGMNNMMTLYMGTWPAVLTAPAGAEGALFTDVLIEALLFDDTDADITNGTPQGLEITNNFDKHGITLLSNADITHTPIELETPLIPIDISADLTLTFPWTNYLNTVTCHYKINGDPTINTIPLAANGNTYTGQIPAQPFGTVVGYYIGATDIFGNVSSVIPIAAAESDQPNIPYFIMVGFSPLQTEDLDQNSDFGNWDTGLSGDNATTGEWELNIPLGSFADPQDPSTMVAPDHQNTPGGELCFLTGKANTINDAIGLNDVDGGTTTLQSPVIDLSGYTNPAFTYYRWYINNPPSGANPFADWWQVYLSDDGGSSWVPVEDTRRSDRSWRRFAFRVQDYVSVNNQFRMKFHVSDSTRPGQYLDGGSLVEAALDDIVLWDNADPNNIQEATADNLSVMVYPNPTNDVANANINLGEAENVNLVLTNYLGQEVWKHGAGTLQSGEHQFIIPMDGLAKGVYMLNVQAGDQRIVHKITRL